MTTTTIGANHTRRFCTQLAQAATIALAITWGQAALAGVVFSYDASTGQFPTDQGWTGLDIDTTGPLTAANVSGTTTDNANAAIEVVEGMNVLHLRDTLTDGAGDLPNYAYPWTAAQQQMLIDNGLKFSMVFQGLPTTTSGKGNVRFGFNNTEFEIQMDNIIADRTIEVLGLSAELAPNDGQFHTLVITGQKTGTNFNLSWSFDGGPSNALNYIANPAPAAIESTIYFGANSSPGRGTDILVKSITMETIVPEPAAGLLALWGAIGVAAARRPRRRQ